MRQAHHLAVRGIGREDVGAHGADILRERHDQLFAYRVDGGIGHLGKLLAEVVEQQLRAFAHHGQRRVVAHGRHRLLARRSHGDNRAVDILLAKAEGDEFLLQVAHSIVDVPPALEFLKLHTVLAEPLAIGMGLGQLILDFAIVVDFAFLRIDEQNFSRLQPAFADDIGGLEVHHAHFRGHHHHSLTGNRVARWAQAVAVEQAACVASVGKE